MITVELKDIRMHAYHGVYEAERIDGSLFELNLSVQYNEHPQSDFQDLNQTIDYAVLFDIVRQRMMVPTPLLEKVAQSIIRRIRHQYPQAVDITLSIYKLNAMIPHLEGKVGVTLHTSYAV